MTIHLDPWSSTLARMAVQFGSRPSTFARPFTLRTVHYEPDSMIWYFCCPPFLNNFCPALFKRVRHIFKHVRHFFKQVRHFFKQVRQLFKHVRHFFKHNFYSNCPPFGMSSLRVIDQMTLTVTCIAGLVWHWWWDSFENQYKSSFFIGNICPNLLVGCFFKVVTKKLRQLLKKLPKSMEVLMENWNSNLNHKKQSSSHLD